MMLAPWRSSAASVASHERTMCCAGSGLGPIREQAMFPTKVLTSSKQCAAAIAVDRYDRRRTRLPATAGHSDRRRQSGRAVRQLHPVDIVRFGLAQALRNDRPAAGHLSDRKGTPYTLESRYGADARSIEPLRRCARQQRGSRMPFKLLLSGDKAAAPNGSFAHGRDYGRYAASGRFSSAAFANRSSASRLNWRALLRR